MNEKDIEKKLKKGIEECIPGAQCLKFVSPGFTGVPDRIILLPRGLVVFVELKRPGQAERLRQKYVQAKFRRLGLIVYDGVDSLEKVDVIIRHCAGLSGECFRAGGDA